MAQHIALNQDPSQRFLAPCDFSPCVIVQEVSIELHDAELDGLAVTLSRQKNSARVESADRFFLQHAYIHLRFVKLFDRDGHVSVMAQKSVVGCGNIRGINKVKRAYVRESL